MCLCACHRDCFVLALSYSEVALLGHYEETELSSKLPPSGEVFRGGGGQGLYLRASYSFLRFAS
jgi:hypothetical protein